MENLKEEISQVGTALTSLDKKLPPFLYDMQKNELEKGLNQRKEALTSQEKELGLQQLALTNSQKNISFLEEELKRYNGLKEQIKTIEESEKQKTKNLEQSAPGYLDGFMAYQGIEKPTADITARLDQIPAERYVIRQDLQKIGPQTKEREELAKAEAELGPIRKEVIDLSWQIGDWERKIYDAVHNRVGVGNDTQAGLRAYRLEIERLEAKRQPLLKPLELAEAKVVPLKEKVRRADELHAELVKLTEEETRLRSQMEANNKAMAELTAKPKVLKNQQAIKFTNEYADEPQEDANPTATTGASEMQSPQVEQAQATPALEMQSPKVEGAENVLMNDNCEKNIKNIEEQIATLKKENTTLENQIGQKQQCSLEVKKLQTKLNQLEGERTKLVDQLSTLKRKAME